MTHIFDLLDAIRSKLIKPNARITVEIFDMYTGFSDGLKFQFLWEENKRLIRVDILISKTEIEHISDDSILTEKISNMVNEKIKKWQKGE